MSCGCFSQTKFTHGKGHQMMTFRAGCGPLVHVNATSQNSACVFVQGRQFTANCYTGMADLATAVSQAPGIKYYGVTTASVLASVWSCTTRRTPTEHRPDVVRIPNAGSLGN